MPFGAITEDIDVAQIALVAFIAFFALLLIYLRREDKREGYPLKPVGRERYPIIGWPRPPSPKTYRLMDGGVAVLPNMRPEPAVAAAAVSQQSPWDLGAFLGAGLGAGAFTLCGEEPMRALDGGLVLMPLRSATDWSVAVGEDDPRGMRVRGQNFSPVGVVTDLWVDRTAKILRYLEVALDHDGGTILLPIFYCDINRREGDVRALTVRPEHVRRIPRLADPDTITPREEDLINAFYAGAKIYA